MHIFIILLGTKYKCKHLNFDKKLSFSGYPLTVADYDYFFDDTTKNSYKFTYFDGKMLENILSPLKPKFISKVVPRESFSINEDGTQVGSSLLKILNGTFDSRATMLQQRYFGDFWRNELNLFIESRVCYAVADRTVSWGEYFQQNYFLPIFLMVMYTFLILETIVTYFYKKYKIKITVDLLRAAIGNATVWEPKTTFKRLIFMLIIFSFIVITSYLQSELTSFIAVTPAEENQIENLDDLISNNYNVFTSPDFLQYFFPFKYYNEIKIADDDCFNSLMRNTSNACANDCFYVEYQTYNFSMKKF